MKNCKRFTAAMACVVVMGMTACGGGKDDAADDSNQSEAVSAATESIEQSDSDTQEENKVAIQEQNVPEVKYVEKPSSDGQQETQEQAALDSDEELEEKLAAYRQAREEARTVSLGNGVTMGGNVNPEEYGISLDTSGRGSFDTGELSEAIDTARSYVENTLGVSVETKQTVYMCVDPRIWAIYSAEDKGVANGYEPENIYVCEYCDNGTWQYLILVRDGKDSAWEVIHHGSSFMEEE